MKFNNYTDVLGFVKIRSQSNKKLIFFEISFILNFQLTIIQYYKTFLYKNIDSFYLI